MPLARRDFLRAASAGVTAAALPSGLLAAGNTPMYGLIGRMHVAPGKRGVVVAALLDGVHAMPGCLSYVVAEDPGNPDAIWVTEVWDSKASHAASLSLPAVQQAIATARPHITGFTDRAETVPLGGHGLGAGK